MSKQDKRLDVAFLLDETGSMDAIKRETISGFNEYLNSLQQGGSKTTMTLVSFDNQRYTVRCAGEKVAQVKPLTSCYIS